MKTVFTFFPFDLFGSPGTSHGVELLADAVREMIDDNRAEKIATRARAYQDRVRVDEFAFDTMAKAASWRDDGRKHLRRVLDKRDRCFWITGNHLGALPIHDELGKDDLVVQFDAHLDVYNLSDCTRELSHGNFLLHAESPLPRLINVGSRELLLRREHTRKTFEAIFPADECARDPHGVLAEVDAACRETARVWIDIDCDVFDPAFFPSSAHPQPFGLSPMTVLDMVSTLWRDNIQGLILSEFEPSRDRDDRSLSTLMWLIEYLLLKTYE